MKLILGSRLPLATRAEPAGPPGHLPRAQRGQGPRRPGVEAVVTVDIFVATA